MSAADIQRAARTQVMIDDFRGNSDEFAMLKGVLCAGNKMRGSAHEAYIGLFNLLMIASRLDELRAEHRALTAAGAA